MLAKFRKFSGSILIKLLFGIIIITMVFWGIQSKNSQKNYVAVIDNDNYIDAKSFVKAKRGFINSITQKYPTLSLEAIDVNKIILDNLIKEKLIELELKDLGLLIGNDIAIKAIKNLDIFKDKNQKFDKEIFKRALMTNEIPEAEYVKRLKTSIATQALSSIIPKFEPSEDFINEFYNYNNQKRIVELVIFKSIDSQNSTAAPSEEEIKDYYEQHKKDFSIAEYRDIEYVIIKQNAFINEVKIVDEEVEQEIINLEEDVNKISDKDKAQIKQRLFEKKTEQVLYDKMKEMEDKLASGDSLKDISAKFKLEHVAIKQINKQGELLNSNKAYTNLPKRYEKILQEAFELDVNNPSDITPLNDKASAGEYYIINVNKIYPSSFHSLEDVKTTITSILAKQKKENANREAVAKIYASFVEAHGDKNILANANATIETKSLSRPEQDASTKISNNDELDAGVIMDIFNLKQKNNYTNIFKTKNGNSSFAILKDIVPPKSSISEKEYKKTHSELSDFITSAIQQELVKYLYSKHKVKVYKDTLSHL